MRWSIFGIVSSFVCAAFAVSTAEAALAGRQRVATGLSSPIYATAAPNDPTRLFIVERGAAVGGDITNSTANIKILDLTTGQVNPTPFLSIPGLNVDGEGGLLGMAFHPDYETNGKFYVYVTANDDVAGTPFSSYIREYTRSSNPNVANAGFNPILNFTQPQANHNGGWIGFGPNDGYLYIMTGDGGNGNDQGTGHTSGSGNAQDLTNNLLGKTLRIDVNVVDADPNDGIDPPPYAIPPSNPFVGSEGDDEIWAYGLRNPFRASFDRSTGDLWIGDVGEGSREEVDFQPAASLGGENYGWKFREGTIATPGIGGTSPANAIDPIYDYRRIGTSGVDENLTGNTVIGGYVYRGPDPSLQGTYFFTDTISNRIWSLRRPAGGGAAVVEYVSPQLVPNVGSPSSPAALAEDASGNLYIVYLSGAVYRIGTNELVDGDFNADGSVDDSDYAVWQANFGGTSGAALAADGNGDNVVDAADYTIWRNNLGNTAQSQGGGGSLAVPEPASWLVVAPALGLAALGRRRRR